MRFSARWSLAALVLTLVLSACVPPAPPKPLGSTVRFGAYVGGMQSDPQVLDRVEGVLGGQMKVASVFYGYGDVFPGPVDRRLAADGRRDLLAALDMGATSAHRFSTWPTGAHDQWLRDLAAAVKAYPHTLYLRPWPEMNGDWQPFQPTADGSRPAGGTPAEFVAAWRYVVTFFRAQGVTNVRWVFNPTADTYAETTDVRAIWPGRQYVDVLGLDGYNWGGGAPWARWQSFEDIFRVQYERLTSLDPTLPVWICEFGSKEPRVDDGAPVDVGQDKGAWYRDAFASTAFPRITTLVAFSIDKERDWRLDSSASSITALRVHLAGVARR